MEQKKQAPTTTTPAPKITKAKKPQKTRPSASIPATDTLTTETAPVQAPAKGSQRKRNQAQPEPQAATGTYQAPAQPQTEQPVPFVAKQPQPGQPVQVVVKSQATPQPPQPVAVVAEAHPTSQAKASPLAQKIAYLRELVGNDAALEDALQRGMVKVSLPGAARTRRVRRPIEERPKTRKNWPKAIVKHVRELRAAGKAYAKIEAEVEGLSPDKGRTSWAIVNLLEGDGY
jgi:hypothetical protein